MSQQQIYDIKKKDIELEIIYEEKLLLDAQIKHTIEYNIIDMIMKEYIDYDESIIPYKKLFLFKPTHNIITNGFIWN
jgi:hypothetical protein